MKATEYLCNVKSFKMLTPTVFEIKFDTNQPLQFTAGQFISVIIPGAGPKGRDLRRAYSIASSPEAHPLELCVKLVDGGPGTQYLYRLREGDTFRGVAPYGDFVYEPKAGRHICFIATGTGIAPFRSIFLSEQYRKNPPASAHFFFGVRSEDELLYDDAFMNVPGLRFVQAVSQPTPAWKGFKGRVTDYIRNIGVDFPWQDTEYYLCGHGGMINEVKAFLSDKGVDKDSIHQEVYYK
jgi:NAD(P)H-flavin reductase